jgi:hypothetical protein
MGLKVKLKIKVIKTVCILLNPLQMNILSMSDDPSGMDMEYFQ